MSRALDEYLEQLDELRRCRRDHAEDAELLRTFEEPIEERLEVLAARMTPDELKRLDAYTWRAWPDQ